MDSRSRTEEDTVYRFAPAAPGGEHVFGACGPGWHISGRYQAAVDDWLSFLRSRNVERVCCLLSELELDVRRGNPRDIERYRAEFGDDRVCHIPIPDGDLADADTVVDDVMPFLRDTVGADERVVVHCRTGLGRTGQILAAWLAYNRGYGPKRAVETVTEMGRAPEQLMDENATTAIGLYDLLTAVRARAP